MNILGDRRIQNTLLYTQLIHFERGDFVSSARAAKCTDDAFKLIEAGFEYVCTTPENLTLFRKRK